MADQADKAEANDRDDGGDAPVPSKPSNSGIASREDVHDALVGKVLNGRVRIVRVIARGGMGKVYYGEQISMGRACAIKVLDPRSAGQGMDSNEYARRFLLEASTSSKLTHPNVVTIFDYGQTEDGVCYIAMEYLEGRTLSTELRDSGRMDPARACDVAKQVARALREAHAMGVVHRDLKPGNVFLVKHDEEEVLAKVLDFGLVKLTASESSKPGGDRRSIAEDEDLRTRVGQVMGSPRYMAPEQVQGVPVDARADIYSLGCVLYAMLTGKPPFVRQTDLLTMMAHVADPVPPMASVAPDLALPEGLEATVLHCMEKDPASRFASMDEVIRALRAGETGAAYSTSGTHAAVPPPSAPLSAPVLTLPADTPAVAPSRGRLWLALGAVAAVALVGIVVASRSCAEAPGAPTAAVPHASVAPPASLQVSLTRPPPSTATAVAQVEVTAVLRVETEPSGARVVADDSEVCEATPCEVVWRGAHAASPSTDHVIEIRKADFKVERRLVKASQGSLSLKLSKAQ